MAEPKMKKKYTITFTIQKAVQYEAENFKEVLVLLKNDHAVTAGDVLDIETTPISIGAVTHKGSSKPTGLREQVFDRDGYKCRMCGSSKNLTLDHIKPKSKGGKRTLDNLQTLCDPCNVTKGNTWNGDVVQVSPRKQKPLCVHRCHQEWGVAAYCNECRDNHSSLDFLILPNNGSN